MLSVFPKFPGLGNIEPEHYQQPRAKNLNGFPFWSTSFIRKRKRGKKALYDPNGRKHAETQVPRCSVFQFSSVSFLLPFPVDFKETPASSHSAHLHFINRSHWRPPPFFSVLLIFSRREYFKQHAGNTWDTVISTNARSSILKIKVFFM